jgi:hypothetical protein
MKNKRKGRLPAKIAWQVLELGLESGALGGKTTMPVSGFYQDFPDQGSSREPFRRPKIPKMAREKHRP